MWSDNKVRELIALKVLVNTLLLNTIVVPFEVFPLESYALMPAPNPPLKTILELVLWNSLQSRRRITPDVNQYHQNSFLSVFPFLREQKKVIWGQIW
jgi:hypothetical protein